MMRYPLPRDTREVLEKSVHQNPNLGLALDRYLQINEELNEQREPWDHDADQWRLTEATKQRQNAPRSLAGPIPRLLRHLNQRRTSMFKGLKNVTIDSLTASPDYRMVIGFGAQHVLETNLCLHRIYGIPIIPGSSVKGVARVQAFWEVAQDLALCDSSGSSSGPSPSLPVLEQLLSASGEDDQYEVLEKLKAIDTKGRNSRLQSLTLPEYQTLIWDFTQVFGTTGQRGQVVFFDAYPTQRPELKVDVLTPHYGRYYRDLDPPADYLDPVPTYFLTVEKGTSFQFYLGSREVTTLVKAKEWLTNALTDLGIGGKTAAGYGFMKVT